MWTGSSFSSQLTTSMLLFVLLLVTAPWAECCGKERCQEICTNDIKAEVEDERTSTTETCFEVCGSDSAESAEDMGETDPVKIQASAVYCVVLHRFHIRFSQSRRRPLLGPSPG